MGKVREREEGEDLKAEVARLTEENERFRTAMLRAQAERDQHKRVIAKMAEDKVTTDRIHRATVDGLLAAVAAASGHSWQLIPTFDNPPGNNGMVD